MAKQMRLTVVRGRPDEVELAAVTAVLLARLSRAAQPDGAGGAEPPPRADWVRRQGRHRPPAGRPDRPVR